MATMATETPLPQTTASETYIDASMASTPTEPLLEDRPIVPPPSPSPSTIRAPEPFKPQRNPFLKTQQCTLHAFPSLEPTRIVNYPSTHLGVPLRKDILHRAVVYEGDNARRGERHVPHRSELPGTSRKIRPQKGTGRARLGDKKSPMLKSGAKAFGPHPRDFSTDLPAKVYNLAFRMALSYRYAQGQLIVLDDLADIENIHPGSRERFMGDFLQHNHMGKTMFVTREPREALFTALEGPDARTRARALDAADADVKDLLTLGRLVIERKALDYIFMRRDQDLEPSMRLRAWRRSMGEA